jgi:hypothetical protein
MPPSAETFEVSALMVYNWGGEFNFAKLGSLAARSVGRGGGGEGGVRLGGCRHWRGERTRSRSAGIVHIIGVIVRIPPPPTPLPFPLGNFPYPSWQNRQMTPFLEGSWWHRCLAQVVLHVVLPSISSSSSHVCTGDHRAGLTNYCSRGCVSPSAHRVLMLVARQDGRRCIHSQSPALRAVSKSTGFPGCKIWKYF